ncbi:fumarylacetoacetate hydrolase family protein [Amantichitinum ursilacus]|uniref:Fumarylpyruvate hydrolase n=1 Tax=Amantichitinum ursilacus TaxID=857265 RepID=A0A0N0XM80_9NEIS|nr:fumarylacetoacetate hydrolase family protein [Amantichitinum ursilacus]KPC54457.1 Fumarylpyruvate hydrolase [Amantichitinum ursilacus]
MPQIQIADRTLTVANIFCVGRNYQAHAAEMGSSIGAEPMVFLKPNSAIVRPGTPLQLPAWSHEIHHETELVVAIGKSGRHIAREDAMQYVAGYALGLDLTARDVQAEAKKKGQPWTLAKGFAGAAVLGQFVPASAIPNPADVSFTLHINDALTQQAHTRDMAFDIPALIAWISDRFGLTEGDLIYTGTPEGVGPIVSGDQLMLQLGNVLHDHYQVA